MSQFRTRVVRTTRVTPGMIRVTVSGDDLHAYKATGEPDESCALAIPVAGSRDEVVRFYTIRRLDRERGEIDLDFVAHGRGPAASWAEHAQPGDDLVLGPARGTYAPPVGTLRHLIIGDASALPAIGRIVEEASAGLEITAVVVVRDRAEEQPLASAAQVDLRWVHARRPEDVPAALVSSARDGEPATDAYVWVAGEASATRSIRTYLRDELGLPRSSHHVLGYWRLDAEAWAARYAAVQADLERQIALAHRTAPSEAAFLDAVERIYADAGL